MNTITYADLNQNAVSQAKREDKAMDNDYRDTVGKVIDRLSALTDLFGFYEYVNDMADFRKKTISGLFYIIDDCIGELENILK